MENEDIQAIYDLAENIHKRSAKRELREDARMIMDYCEYAANQKHFRLS